MCYHLADKVYHDNFPFDIIVGMVTGGMLPAFRIKQILSYYYCRPIPYIYQRGSRKVGGHQELDTGDRNNPFIKEGCRALVVEELINYAETTTNGILHERAKGRIAEDVACILFYNNPVAIDRLQRHNIMVHYVMTLEDLLTQAEVMGYYDVKLIDQYREYLINPQAWHERKGYEFFKGR